MAAEEKSKIKKVEPYTREWKKIAKELALAYTPNITPCDDCNYPVIKGFCCENCGSLCP
jgi:anaerobic ribonucleoside-triphosphate reductase